jgi:hypothetical protein
MPCAVYGQEVITIPEMQVTLHFIPILQIKKFGRTNGYAMYTNGECHVYVPTGAYIHLRDGGFKSLLDDPGDYVFTVTIPHEIAHCLKGAWH